MKGKQEDMVEIFRRQLAGSFDMLGKTIELCPESVWNAGGEAAPVWEHVYHALFFMTVWLEDWKKKREFPAFHVDGALELKKIANARVSKDQVKGYMAEVGVKTESFFARLSPEALTEKSEQWGKEWTTADRILGQIRHVQHHAAYVNAVLRLKGAAAAEWIGYNE